jgi:hypothetical protein
MQNKSTIPVYSLDRFGEFAAHTTTEIAELRSMLAGFLKSQEDRLLSPAQACAIFSPKISRPTLKKWTDEGFIAQQRIGGRVFYKYSEVINAGRNLKRYHKP